MNTSKRLKSIFLSKFTAPLLAYVAFFVAPTTCFGLENTPKAPTKISVSVHGGTFIAYGMGDMENVCSELTLKEGINNHRTAVELVLICRAFEEAQFPVIATAISAPTYARGLRNVEQGITDTIAESIWLQSLNKNSNVYQTDEVIRSNELEKGIFTAKDHVLQQLSIEDIQLKHYSSVTFTTWHHDHELLKATSKHVHTTTQFLSLTKMLENGRADFSLLEFQKESPRWLRYRGISLKSVKGIKVQFSDARVFVLSKKNKESEKIFNALNAGVKRLRENGEIERFYIKHGVFSAEIKDWKILDPATGTIRTED